MRGQRLAIGCGGGLVLLMVEILQPSAWVTVPLLLLGILLLFWGVAPRELRQLLKHAGPCSSYFLSGLNKFERAIAGLEQRAGSVDQAGEAKRYIKVGGEANPYADNGYDLFVSAHNPTANTVRNVSASLLEIIAEPENNEREKIQRLIGVPLSPEGKRVHHKPTPEHIDIHPADTCRFEIGRVHFVAPSSRSKSHIAISVAETTPVLDGQGRTWYTHGVDRGIHFPDKGEWKIRIIVRGQDIKPEQAAFLVNLDAQTVRSVG